jgi:hypothetical protein
MLYPTGKTMLLMESIAGKGICIVILTAKRKVRIHFAVNRTGGGK